MMILYVGMVRMYKRLLLMLAGLCLIVCSPSTATAIDLQFYASNGLAFYKPEAVCDTDTVSNTGGANIPPYTNPVYNKNAPDPAVILGDDGYYYVYATGGTLLKSRNLVNWEKIDDNWKLVGAPNKAGGKRWAPDVAKIGSKYILTYTIPTGTPRGGGTGSPTIGYAISDTAGGEFKYTGEIDLPNGFNIDSHIFVDDDQKIWLFYGGGTINVIQLTFDGVSLKKTGSKTQLLTKGGVGSNATIEGSWVEKRNGWYYLTYSQGHFSKSDGPPEYRVLVARSKSITGPYTPNKEMKPILEGKDPVHYPGHHSITKDSKGNEWIVYHGYYSGGDNRVLMIDPISYDSEGWPVVNSGNGPSGAQQPGTGGSDSGNPVSTSSAACCAAGLPNNSLLELRGKENLEKIYNYMIDKGLSAEQAAGVVGNISQESGGDPENTQSGYTPDKTKDPMEVSKKNGSRGGWGIIQWTPSDKVLDLAKNSGTTGPIYELKTQLDILWWHMTDTSPTGAKNMYAEYSKVNDIETAVRMFEDKIEGAGSPRIFNRIQAAHLAYKQYGTGSSTASADTAQMAISGCAANGAAAGNAVQTAINYAWPDRNVDPKQKKKPSYANAIDTAQKAGKYTGDACYGGGVDCGAFVTRVMQDSGVDPKYGGGGNTAIQLGYMLEHPEKYQEIHPKSSSDNMPGDIAVQNNNSIHHTYMYVGKQPGFDSTIASASQCNHAPWAGEELAADPDYRWFRVIK